jgi:hypothetical protein
MHELLSEDLRGCFKNEDEVEAGRLQIFEAGRRSLARIFETLPWVWIRYQRSVGLVPEACMTDHGETGLGKDLGGCFSDMDEVEAGRNQVLEAGIRTLTRILEAVS